VWRIGALRGRQAWLLGLRKSGGGGKVCSGGIGVSSGEDVCSVWSLGITRCSGQRGQGLTTYLL
jgi:hypothetical protein